MRSDWAFKLVFLGVFCVAVAVAARTARRATEAHGGSVNQLAHEVRGLVFVRALLGLVFYGALGAWVLGRAGWMSVPLPLWLRVMAALLCAPMLLFFRWAFASLGTNYRGGVGLHDSHGLVTTGAYRWMRHPIYAAFIALMLLVFLLSANWVLGLSGLLLVASIAAVRAPVEDRELASRFGSQWTSWAQSTRAFLPLRRKPGIERRG